MMRNIVRIGITVTLLGLSACSQKNESMGEVAAAAPVVVEGTADLERKSDCIATDMDDGIGGTGCPVID